jgi:type VI secretion system protein VasD
MFRSALAALFALLLTSCSKDAPPTLAQIEPAADVASLTLNFHALAGLNPGASGQPAPVRVRVFELKNTANFTRADYFALADRAQPTLGPDLIDQDEVLVQPGQRLSIDRSLAPATRHVGLVVGYREIDQAQWRAVVDVAPGQHRGYLISLDARAIRTDVSTPTRPAQ